MMGLLDVQVGICVAGILGKRNFMLPLIDAVGSPVVLILLHHRFLASLLNNLYPYLVYL